MGRLTNMGPRGYRLRRALWIERGIERQMQEEMIRGQTKERQKQIRRELLEIARQYRGWA